MMDIIAKLDIGISYIFTFIINNIGSSQASWDGPMLKLKLILNLISICAGIYLVWVMGYGLWDNYVLQPQRGQDTSWDKKDAWRILGGSFGAICMFTTLLGSMIGGLIVYFIK